jgi:TolA-binding protein
MQVPFRATVAGFLLVIGSGALFAEEPSGQVRPGSGMSKAQQGDLFQEAERLRLQGDYPKAAEVYRELLVQAPAGPHHEMAIQRLYDIANYWLEDTRDRMRVQRDLAVNTWISCVEFCPWLADWLPDLQPVVQRWLRCKHLFHLDRTKPFFDEESEAVEMLGCVSAADPDGPLADKALFLMGSVWLFREDYERAEEPFSRLVERHGKSPLAAQALELAIVTKHLSLDQARDEGQKLTEIRRLIDKAFREYPELGNNPMKREFLVHQLALVDIDEGERALKAAEEARKAGRLKEARRGYKAILSRYPQTVSAGEARERLEELKGQAKDQ